MDVGGGGRGARSNTDKGGKGREREPQKCQGLEGRWVGGLRGEGSGGLMKR